MMCGFPAAPQKGRRPAPSYLFDWLWLIAWAALSSAWCLSAAGRLGPTFDEPTYVAGGLERWRTGAVRPIMRLGTMPLAIDLTTLPIFAWERARGTPFDIALDERSIPVRLRDLDRVLPLARASTLIFWWLLLYCGWRAGDGLAGRWGGRLAVALLAIEPTLLAHASLATTDVAVSACLLAMAYWFRLGRESVWRLRVGAPALWFGLALLSKASALVFGPLTLLALEMERRAHRRAPLASSLGGQPGAGRRWRALLPFARDVYQIVLLGLALTFAYCGSDWRAERSFVAWAHRQPVAAWWSSPLVYAAEHLTVFSNAGDALVRQIRHNIRGHGVYIMGRNDDRAVWYYFPVAATIKLTVPLLVAPLLVFAVRRRALINWAVVAALILLACSASYRVQTGIRIVLPAVVLLTVGVAAAAVETIRSMRRDWARRVGALGTAACVIWTATESALVWPNALCFTNELWGGTSKGYLYLSDSNYDWGQGLPELRHWQLATRVENLSVWYWGTDPSLGNGAWQAIPLHTLSINTPQDVAHHLAGHYVAASTSWMYGSAFVENADAPPEVVRIARSIRHLREVLRTRTPVSRTTTFLIYDFTHGP